jgi:hypothetical protein
VGGLYGLAQDAINTIQGTDSERPTIQANALRIGAAESLRTTHSKTAAQSIRLTAVFKINSNEDQIAYFFNLDQATRNWWVRNQNASTLRFKGKDDSSNVTVIDVSLSTGDLTDYFVLSAIAEYDGTDLTTRFKINTQAENDTTISTSPGATFSASTLSLTATNNRSGGMYADMKYFEIKNDTLNPSALDDLHTFLMNMHGVSS